MMNRVNSNMIPPVADRPLAGKGKRSYKRWFFGIAVLFGIVLVGCSQGTYPVDIFYEQHYQQSYRSHEPPRLTGVAGDDWQAAFIRGTRPRKEMPSLLDLQVGDHLESL